MSEKDIIYSKLAKYYDMTRHFRDYQAEAEFVDAVIKRYLPDTSCLLDVCCGTGSHAILLAEKGYEIVGVDLSEEMLTIAKQKFKCAGRTAKFINADARTLECDAEFDVAYCLGGSFMLLTNYEDINRCLAGVRRALKPGGIFIFSVDNGWDMLDVPTKKFVSEEGSTKVVWLESGYVDRMKRVRHLDWTWIIEDGGNVSIESGVEELRIFFHDELQMLMTNASFEITATFGDKLLDIPFHAKSEHIVMVANRPL